MSYLPAEHWSQDSKGSKNQQSRTLSQLSQELQHEEHEKGTGNKQAFINIGNNCSPVFLHFSTEFVTLASAGRLSRKLCTLAVHAAPPGPLCPAWSCQVYKSQTVILVYIYIIDHNHNRLILTHFDTSMCKFVRSLVQNFKHQLFSYFYSKIRTEVTKQLAQRCGNGRNMAQYHLPKKIHTNAIKHLYTRNFHTCIFARNGTESNRSNIPQLLLNCLLGPNKYTADSEKFRSSDTLSPKPPGWAVFF